MESVILLPAPYAFEKTILSESVATGGVDVTILFTCNALIYSSWGGIGGVKFYYVDSTL